MGRFNLSGCLTPTGIPYVTNRGGPLVGEELLLLQGIPADDLLLTKESEKNLKDLSGNGEFENGLILRIETVASKKTNKANHVYLLP